jgi:NAD+ diphosphatase
MSNTLAFAFSGRSLLVLADEASTRVPTAGDLATLLDADAMAMLEAEVPLPTVGDTRCRAFDLPEGFQAPEGAKLIGLRELAGLAPAEVFAAAGTAVQKVEWLRTHGFCSRCGGTTERHARHEALACTACGHMHFARLSPAVIMLVERGREMLLGRSHGWPEGVYSTLAGFVDPGESLEDAVHREILEEVGVTVTDLKYFGSQPWPFPNSLMVGFTATYVRGVVTPDPVEIEDAGWFSPENLPPRLPFKTSIARALVDDFLSRMGGDGD